MQGMEGGPGRQSTRGGQRHLSVKPCASAHPPTENTVTRQVSSVTPQHLGNRHAGQGPNPTEEGDPAEHL